VLIEAKPRDLEQHHQKPNDGGLPLRAALQPFVLVQYGRHVVLPIERNHAATSACEPTRGRGTWDAEVMKDPWVTCLADNLSDAMVVATTASQGLRHGSVSGTLGFVELARPRWGRAISSLITAVSQLRKWIMQMSADAAAVHRRIRTLRSFRLHPLAVSPRSEMRCSADKYLGR